MKIGKKVLLIVVFAFIFTGLNLNSYAVIDVENATENGDFNVFGTRIGSISVSHFIETDANVLYVGVSNHRTGLITAGLPCGILAASLTTTANFVSASGTQAMEKLTDSMGVSAVLSDNTCNSVEVFRLESPAQGNGTVNINQTLGGDYVVVGAVSFSGVDTSSGVTFVPSDGNDRFPFVNVGTTANDVVLDVLAADFAAGLATPNASQTEQWDGEDFFSFSRSIGAGSTKPATTTSTITNWTLSDPGQWALAGIDLKPAAISASPSSIGGVVQTRSGRSIPDTLVFVRNLQTGEQIYTQTDEKGSYIVGELDTGVSYLVGVYNFRYEFEPNQKIVSLLDSVGNLNFSGRVRRNQTFDDYRR